MAFTWRKETVYTTGTGTYTTPTGAKWLQIKMVGGGGGGGSWGAISDSRLKINITPLVGALEKINSLNPVSYDWKIVKENEPTVGFIAQDVQKILPNAVTSHIPTEEESEFIVDETMTIGWQNDMFAYLVGAIKELTAEIAELKKT